MGYTICPKCGADAYAQSQYDGYYCFPNQNGCGATFPIHIVRADDLLFYDITPNDFLTTEICGYSHDFYIPMKLGGGKTSKLILTIKNSFGDAAHNEIEAAKTEISKVIKFDLDKIIKRHQFEKPIAIVVPRSKPDNYWNNTQLQFRPAVAAGILQSNLIIDGTQYLTRCAATQTTHIAHLNNTQNTGEPPYPGITKDTCRLNENIVNKNVILIDDIYTVGVGVDEDCVQFLLDNGAASVILYTLGITIKIPRSPTNDISPIITEV